MDLLRRYAEQMGNARRTARSLGYDPDDLDIGAYWPEVEEQLELEEESD